MTIEQLKIKAKELKELLIKDYNLVDENNKEEIIQLTTLSKVLYERFKLRQEIKELKEKVKELTVFKEQIEDLEKKTVEILTKVKKEEDEEITYWEKGEPQELLENIKKGNLVQTVIRVIKKIKKDAKIHLNFIDSLKEWNGKVKSELQKEIADKSETLRVNAEELEEKDRKYEELEKKLEENFELLEEVREQLKEEEKKNQKLFQICLGNKQKQTLPNLPNKKSSKFKILKNKMKTKFQQLTEKKKVEKPEMVARIEVKTS